MAREWPQLPRGARHWSNSRFEAFKCPHRYKKKYLDKVAEPVSEALHKGRILHDVTNNYIDHLVQAGLQTDVTAMAEIAKGVFFAPAAKEPHNLPPGAFEEVLRVSEAFAGSFCLNRETVCDYEQPWAIPIGDAEDGLDYLWVIIDLLEIDGNKATIVDWKSDWHLRSQADIEEDLQLQIYAWGALKQYPFLDEFEVRLHFLRHQKDRWTTYTRDEVEAVEPLLVARIEQIKGEKKWAAQPGKDCQWCGYANDCPALQKLQAAGTILVATPEEAARIAGEIQVLEQQLKARKEALKSWCSEGGPVPVNGVTFGFFATESYTVDDTPAFFEAIQAAGRDPWKYVKVDSRTLKPLLRDEDAMAKVGHLIVDRSYTTFTSRKGGDADAA